MAIRDDGDQKDRVEISRSSSDPKALSKLDEISEGIQGVRSGLGALGSFLRGLTGVEKTTGEGINSIKQSLDAIRDVVNEADRVARNSASNVNSIGIRDSLSEMLELGRSMEERSETINDVVGGIDRLCKKIDTASEIICDTNKGIASGSESVRGSINALYNRPEDMTGYDRICAAVNGLYGQMSDSTNYIVGAVEGNRPLSNVGIRNFPGDYPDAEASIRLDKVLSSLVAVNDVLGIIKDASEKDRPVNIDNWPGIVNSLEGHVCNIGEAVNDMRYALNDVTDGVSKAIDRSSRDVIASMPSDASNKQIEQTVGIIKYAVDSIKKGVEAISQVTGTMRAEFDSLKGCLPVSLDGSVRCSIEAEPEKDPNVDIRKRSFVTDSAEFSSVRLNAAYSTNMWDLSAYKTKSFFIQHDCKKEFEVTLEVSFNNGATFVPCKRILCATNTCEVASFEDAFPVVRVSFETSSILMDNPKKVTVNMTAQA